MLNNKLTIGELAKQLGITIRTLRYYDKIGLLKPSDYKEGGHRLYSIEAIVRLQQIQSLKFIGLSLRDISSLLETEKIEQKYLKEAIIYKKKELTSQLEELERTINQLDHMDTVITDQQHVDLRIFCFIIHSIIWEEKYLDEYNDIKKSMYNLTHIERAELDKKYFELFTEIKELVSRMENPASIRAQTLIQKLIQFSEQTISNTIERQSIKSFNHLDLLDPFTTEEREFLKEATSFYMNNSKS
ncbi:MerR family transcriptional regulator [Metabacillus fastidiosus]|uniref:MerR family transcriptional regulator n=1 Tax=Metabacillus fastidiosus TaxID=1458 RepID=UPI003D2CDD5A